MSLVENHAAFFADFGVPATIAGTPLTVIFDNDFLASLGIESSNPIALAESALLPALLLHGDEVVIGGVNYRTVGIQPDGTGMTMLDLEKF